MTHTFEVTKSTLNQRSYLSDLLGYAQISWEKLDEDTWNVTVPEDRSDDATECLDKQGLSYRFI